MSESVSRHGLENFLAKNPLQEAQADMELRILQDRGHINLRGNPLDSHFLEVSRRILGQDLALENNTITVGEHLVFWLGPNEWLLVSPDAVTRRLLNQFEMMLSDCFACATDLSGGQMLLEIEGDQVRQLLAKGCTINFHPREFKHLSCVQSGIAKASALIGYVREPDCFAIVVRRSFGEYLANWLSHAGRDFGIGINQIRSKNPPYEATLEE